MAKFIPTTGKPKMVKPNNDTDFSLKELQEFVGGYIEVIRLRDNRLLIVNEEGRIHNLPFNEYATLAAIVGGFPTEIVGNALLCKSTEVK